MTTWNINTDEAARDLRVDTETDLRTRLKSAAPAAPDFSKLRGPGNKYTRRLSGRNN